MRSSAHTLTLALSQRERLLPRLPLRRLLASAVLERLGEVR